MTITAGQSAGFMDRLRGIFEPSNLLRNTNVLTIKPTGLMSLVTDKVPQQLVVDDTQITTLNSTENDPITKQSSWY